MAKRILITLFLFGYFMAGESSATESEGHGVKGSQKTEMTPSQEENARKMMLLKEHMMNMDAAQPQVHGHIANVLHAVTSNPVLDAELVYTPPNEKISFKIGTKVKDGMIDFTDSTFGALANYLVITTDPSVFFAKHGDKVVMLIAPKSLIHDNLKTSSAPFEPIMKDWNEKIAPIGIFWRDGSALSPDITKMVYLTDKDISVLSGDDLGSLLNRALYERVLHLDDEQKKLFLEDIGTIYRDWQINLMWLRCFQLNFERK